MTSPLRPRARRLAPEARRAQILAAALPVFARRGFVGAGTRDVARAAGVTEPVLYRHFADKADLFRAVVEAAAGRLVERLEAAVAGEPGAAARLHGLAEGLPRLIDACRDELRVLTIATLAHEEPAVLEAAGSSLRRVGRALADAFRGSGLRPGVSAETAGFLLLEVGLGAAMVRRLTLPEVEHDRFSDRAVRALLGGLARS